MVILLFQKKGTSDGGGIKGGERQTSKSWIEYEKVEKLS